MKRLVPVLALSALSSLAMADATAYHYGQHLDIARVISQTLPQTGCAVGEAQMVYLDSKGEQHTLTYLRQGENCID